MAVERRPIGVFDSGIGGLTVVREILRELPGEEVLFFGDTARLPYGPKSKETVLLFARQNTNFLLSRNVRCVVVACNTASSVAIPALSAACDVPVIGVIEPGAAAAAKVTKSGSVGVIGTRGTIASGAYEKALHDIDRSIRVTAAACPLLVPLAEEGWVDRRVTRDVIGEYLGPLLANPVDTIILGCTHFPVLKDAIRDVAGPEITLVDNAVATAAALRSILPPSGGVAASPTVHHFVVSDVPHRFQEEAELFLGRPIGEVERISPEQVEEYYRSQ